VAYDAENLRVSVRNMFQNISEDVMEDSVLVTFLEAGLRRLSHDRPRERSIVLPTVYAPGWYDLTAGLVPDWAHGFSTVRGLASMFTPGLSADITWMRFANDYDIVPVGDQVYLLIRGRLGTEGALMKYITPWAVQGIEGALSTTVVPQLINALELVCAVEVARGRAANSAGKVARSLAADIVDWNNKQREYSNQAREWERRYWNILGFDTNGGPPPVMISIDYDFEQADGYLPVTHYD
jgi:hypothetical protein